MLYSLSELLDAWYQSRKYAEEKNAQWTTRISQIATDRYNLACPKCRKIFDEKETGQLNAHQR